MHLGRVARAAGDDMQASRLMAESLALYRTVGDQKYVGGLLLDLGRTAHSHGDDTWAALLYRESLLLWEELGSTVEICDCLEGLAGSALVAGQPQRAVRLLGAAAALREACHSSPLPDYRLEIDRNVTLLRTQLAPAVFDAAWAEGRAMTLEQAIAYALDETVD